jgi:outer membrane protein
MKSFLVAMNLILLALVGYLYYLHFNSNKKSTTFINVMKDSSGQSKARVAYIDLDSLQANYDYYKKLKAESDKKQEAATNEIVGLQNKYQAKAGQYQQKGSTMTQKEQDDAMKDLGGMQQSFQKRKQELDNELYSYTSKLKEDILTRIQNFLKEYNKDNKYDYVFSYEPGFMFYKDSTLNITKDVVEGLNEKYSKEKK